MLYGVLDYTTSSSALVDPIVLQDRAEKAAALAAEQAQLKAASQTGPLGGWAVLLAAVAGGVWWYSRQAKKGLMSEHHAEI